MLQNFSFSFSFSFTFSFGCLQPKFSLLVLDKDVLELLSNSNFMFSLSSSLEKVIEDIEVKLRITNRSCNCKGLRLNYIIILLYFVVHSCTSLSKDYIRAKVSPQKLKLMQKLEILWNCVVHSRILLSLKLFARSYKDSKELKDIIQNHPIT